MDRFKVYEQLPFEAVPKGRNVRTALLKLTDDQIAECLSARWAETDLGTVERYVKWSKARDERAAMLRLHPNGSPAPGWSHYSISALRTWHEPQFFQYRKAGNICASAWKGPGSCEWWNGEVRPKVFSTWVGTGPGQYVWHDPVGWHEYAPPRAHGCGRDYQPWGKWFMTTLPADKMGKYERDRWSSDWVLTAAERKAREQQEAKRLAPFIPPGHWATLGVKVGASKDDIKTAYRKLASKHHPDKGGDSELMAKINVAYANLVR